MIELSDLEGHRFGPHPFHVSFGNVADYVEATDGDAARWLTVAPPGFVAAALFVVAPDLLNQLAGHSVIHGEQTFQWHRAIEMGSELSIAGTVGRVRERGGVHFVTFELEVGNADGLLAEGSSRFLISGASSPVSSPTERDEPSPHDRGSPGPGEIGVSRADLIRYAAATRDWNPVHWDHAAAVAAGLPGIVVHGLLQASWAFNASMNMRDGEVPLRSARVRFRNPLLPAQPVRLETNHEGDKVDVKVRDDRAEYVSALVELTPE